MKCIALFLATSIAIVLVLGITLRILGVERILDEQGAGLDTNNLLVFAAVFGFGGSFISLAIFKWTARRFTGAQLSSREKMASALERLKATVEQPDLPDRLAVFGISGGISLGLKKLFMSHPPLDERIARLRSSY